ncbi:MAG: YfhO family protein [Thioploca sp.]|nr:YfhO family protein [Thioploca sp.]
MGIYDGKKIYFSNVINYLTVTEFLKDTKQFENLEYSIVLYTGDKLILDIQAPKSGYLSFIDNWDPDWIAMIDNQLVPIEILFGTFKSVYVQKGKHRVTFTYHPKLLGKY